MRHIIAVTILLLTLPATTDAAVVYCKYIGVPKGCVARAGVRLHPAPAAAVVTPGYPGNRGGPVNHVGPR